MELAERLLGKGFEVKIYEPSIAPGKLHGTNLNFIERSIPHIWKLLVGSLDELFQHAEAVVVMQQVRDEDRRQFGKMKSNQICIDLARTLSAKEVGVEYRSVGAPKREMAVPVSIS